MKKVLFILVFGLMSAKNDTFQNAYNSAKGNSIDINEDYNIPPLSYLESYALMKAKQICCFSGMYRIFCNRHYGFIRKC